MQRVAARAWGGAGARSVSLALALMYAQTGCLPHVLHNPRVDDGVSGSLSLTLGRNYEFGDSEVRIAPSLYAGLRAGFVPQDGSGLAASFGVQVPPLIAPFLVGNDIDALDALGATSYADLYIQPARRAEPGLEYGIGALASTELIAPYLQVGKLRATGSGWYTTQLAGRTSGGFERAFFYIPTVVLRVVEGTRRSAANFSFGTGFFSQRDAETDVVFILGATFELGLGDR